MRRACLLALALCAALPGCPAARATKQGTEVPQPQQPPQAPVVVALVVDQLAAWEAAERFEQLPKSGGFARLRREGFYVPEMRYAHAVTETAAGHAALFTGTPPNRSGMYANERIEPMTRTPIPALMDFETKAIGARGPTGQFSVSLKILEVDTVADVLRARSPHATIVSISLKDRGSVFGAGRHPDAALWYDRKDDAFVTSTAFANAYPEWAARALESVAALRDKPWTLLDPVFASSHARQPDNQDGESDVFGFGRTFPHDFASARKPTVAFRASPRGDEALFRLAAASLTTRKQGEPMLLSLSLSSFDYVSHFWGPDSWEAWDELLRLDGALGEFFQLLDRTFGEAGWSAILSSDHGGPPLPELPDSARPWCKPGAPPDHWERPCGLPERLFPNEVDKELRAEAKRVLGDGDWVLGVTSPYVFYTDTVAKLPADRRKALDDALTHALLAHPGIERVYPSGGGPCPPENDESIDALVCRSLSSKNPNALFVLAKKGSFFDTEYDIGKGQSHGGPYLFDRAVPMFVRMGGQARTGVHVQPASYASYTRTLASLLGVPAPASASPAEDFARR